ncbi:IS630 family transposase [Schlesneria sp. T3-172]|uniref:IS630 family transposase n=1 Tax=Schlesneria sphaerica TaxID=3373610 RepID=UPI0037C7DDFD
MEVSSRHHSLEQLQALERQEKDAARAKRLRIVVLAMQGWTAPAIAMAVGFTRRVCQRWVYQYNELGLPGLDDRRGRTPGVPLSEEAQQQLRQRLDAGPKPEDQVCSLRGKDLQRILQQEFGCVRSLSSIYWLLHRLGYSYLRPRPKHYKANPQVMQEFQTGLKEQIQQIQAAQPDKKLRIYFQDEARFGQQGTTTNVWAPTGSRPQVVRQTEYQYLWVLGTVCPQTGHAEGLLSPRLNTAVINVFLKQFSTRIPKDEHAVMIWDGAGFHRSGTLRVPQNITLIRLPAYSPELNPIENLWHYLKSHHWSNRAYPDYPALEAASQEAWRASVLDPELMKTVCAAPWLDRALSN